MSKPDRGRDEEQALRPISSSGPVLYGPGRRDDEVVQQMVDLYRVSHMGEMTGALQRDELDAEGRGQGGPLGVWSHEVVVAMEDESRASDLR